MKLYVRETGSRTVKRRVQAAVLVATSRVAYPEARAALARREREGALTTTGLRRAVAALDRDLGAYVIVEVAAALAQRAGGLAEKHALRGFDSLHLASALELQSLVGATPVFVAYDLRLMAAAAAEGLLP